MNKDTVSIDIKSGDLDIYVYGQLILHIGQVSDGDVINIFLYPEGDIIKSMLSEDNPKSKCTHEIIRNRK